MNCQQVRDRLDEFILESVDTSIDDAGIDDPEIDHAGIDPAARARIEQHLARCENCRRLAEERRRIADLLPHALARVSPYHPPARLKSQLLNMAQQSAEVQAHQLRTRSAWQNPAPRVGFVRVRALLNPRLWFASIAVSAAAIIALFAFSVVSNMQLEQARRQVDALQRQQEKALQVMNSNQTIEIGLAPTTPNSRASGKVLIRPDLDTVVVTTNHLPQPPLGKEYLLWVTARGLQQLAGILKVNETGYGVLVFETDRKGPIFKAIDLVLQAPNSVLPSGDRVLSWEANPNDPEDILTWNGMGNRFLWQPSNGADAVPLPDGSLLPETLVWNAAGGGSAPPLTARADSD